MERYRKKIFTRKKKKDSNIILVDANNLGHIAFFSMGGLSNEDDEYVGVIFGFLNSLLSISTKLNPSKVVFFWDSKRNLRKRFNPGYKANRKKDLSTEEKEKFNDMYRQFDLLQKDILPRLGFTSTYRRTGFEADDLIAYYCQNFCKDVNTIIISTDSDLLQLLNTNVSVYNPSTKIKMTPTKFEKKYGIKPNQWTKVKAIAGDSSDNIRGVYGAGEKTAIKYIKGKISKDSRKYRDIWGAEELIKANMELITLPYKCEVQLKLINKKQGPLKKTDFIKVFDELRFIYFMKDAVFPRWEKAFNLK